MNSMNLMSNTAEVAESASDTTNLHEAALAYAEAGMAVFPLLPQDKKPAIKDWPNKATIDLNVINEWWSKNPNFNIGIITGSKSGFIVVDFDTDDAWELGKRNGLSENTPIVKTARGYHVYFQYQTGVNNFQSRSDMPGIDLRGDGGYVVAPPSIHPSGERYSWVNHYDDYQYKPLPDWVTVNKPSHKKSVGELCNGVSEGRNSSMTRIAGAMAADGFTYDDMVTSSYLINEKHETPLEEKELLTVVKSIYKREHGDLPKVADTWEEPILFHDIETPEISADLLPSWLGAYAREVSKFTQTPESLSVMMALSTVATCVQKRFEVSPYGDDYIEPLSLWTVTVLPPSERKSPVVKELTAPLAAWRHEKAQEIKVDAKKSKTRRDILQKSIDRLTQEAAKEEDPDKQEELIQKIVTLQESMPEEIKAPQLWTNDITAERLQDLLAENGERMAVISDEAGIFEIMGGLYNDGKVNIDIFLQGYAGMAVEVNRRGRDVSLARPAISFGITMQPSVLETFSRGSKKAFRGQGALARFLYCIPKPRVGSRDVYDRATISAEVKSEYQKQIKKFLDLPANKDEKGLEVPSMLTLSPAAQRCLLDFANEVEGKLGEGRELSSLGDWGGKLPGNAARIAGIMHLAEHGTSDLVVQKQTVDDAVTLARLLTDHAKAAFGYLSTDEAVVGAKKVFKWILEGKQEAFKKNDCQRSMHGTFDNVADLEKPLKVLEERHVIKQHKVASAGRPQIWYDVNPAVFGK